MFDDKLKFIILAAGCFQMLARAATMSGALAVFSVYYAERFNDRTLSSTIPAIQYAVTHVFILPAMIASKRFGTRSIQIIGAVFNTAGLLGTAFTTVAWQALITNGVIAAFGEALIMAASFTIVSNHFPGRQLYPYATMLAVFQLGATVSPVWIAYMMTNIGFTNTFIVCAIIMSVNIVTGIFYKPAECNDERSDSESPKLSLKIERSTQGIFYIESPTDVPSKNKMSVEGEAVEERPNDGKESYRLSTFMDQWMEKKSTEVEGEEQSKEKKVEPDSLRSKAVIHYGNDSIADLMKEKKEQNIMTELKQMLTTYKSLHYLATIFLTGGGVSAFMSNIGDYATFYLQLSKEEYTQGLILYGIALLVVAVLFILLNKCFDVSSLAIQMIASFILAMVAFIYITHPSIGVFNILMVINGASYALYDNSAYGCGMDVTSPEQANLMYGVSKLFLGGASFATSYLTAYLQTKVDPRAGLTLIGGVLTLGAILLLPLSIKTLCTPKSYSSGDVKDKERAITEIS